MKAHPAVPAAIVMKHVQGSKNRVTRHAADAENVRRGMRALYEDANALRAALQNKPDEIVVLERGFMALDFVARDLVAGHEQMIKIEQAFQNECLLWLNRKQPRVPVVPQKPAICYVPSKAMEVPTPKAILEGQTPQGEPTKELDATKAAGFYTMADGTKVYVNHLNEPIPAPSEEDVAKAGELVKAPENVDQAYVPMAPPPPTEEAPEAGGGVSPTVEHLTETSNGTPSIGEQT